MLGTTMPTSRDWEENVCSGTEILQNTNYLEKEFLNRTLNEL
jgi:hypothetical protein